MAESLPDHDGCRPLQVHVRRAAGRGFVAIKTLAFTSDGRQFANPRALKQSECKLRRCDKAIARSRNTHGRNRHSNRRLDLHAERARLHRRIRRQRETAHRMAASAIAKSAGTVVKLDLGVRMYRCARCGWECDRDANAALNLAAWRAAHVAGEAVNGYGNGVGRPGAHPDATVSAVPSDGTSVDLQRSARVAPHRR